MELVFLPYQPECIGYNANEASFFSDVASTFIHYLLLILLIACAIRWCLNWSKGITLNLKTISRSKVIPTNSVSYGWGWAFNQLWCQNHVPNGRRSAPGEQNPVLKKQICFYFPFLHLRQSFQEKWDFAALGSSRLFWVIIRTWNWRNSRREFQHSILKKKKNTIEAVSFWFLMASLCPFCEQMSY